MVVQISLTLVSTVTVGAGGAANIEFTNIPQTGKDLLLVCSLRQTTGSELIVEYNNFAGSYVTRTLGGDGTTVYSSSSTDAGVRFAGPQSTFTANTFSNSQIYFSNYTSSTTKSVSTDSVTENNATRADQQILATSIANNNPITNLKLWQNFAQHSTASLYIIS